MYFKKCMQFRYTGLLYELVHLEPTAQLALVQV